MADSAYTLCGFASGVDFRPIKFKECLPPVRVCGFCGFVPDKIAVLPCSHQLCESCLHACADGDGFVCAIDRESFLVKEEVSWITHTRRHLSKMLVFCWNKENGCEFVGPTEKLLQHFEQECDFHAFSCSRCHDTVLRKEVPQHYKEGCSVSSRDRTLLLEEVTSSHHDILASIETGVNELVEAVKKMSLELSGSKEHRATDVVEEQLREVASTLRNVFDPTKTPSASISLARSSTERSISKITREITPKEPAEDVVVLAFEYEGNGECEYVGWGFEDTFTLCIQDEVTNVEIQFLWFFKAQFVSVSAKLTEQGRWGLPDIEPLSLSQVRPTSLRGVVYRPTTFVKDIETRLQAGYILRCIDKPAAVFDGISRTKIISFLIRMRLSDTSNL